jgi:hypothetical protein
MASDNLATQVHERLTSATKDYPWVQDMLTGERSGQHLDTAIMIGGLTALCGGIIEALGLLADQIGQDR